MPGTKLAFVDNIQELAAMPKISIDLMAMLQDTTKSLDEIAHKIELDPALVSFILKTSNSAFYGIKQEIRTIQSAVKMLGLPETRSILMSYFLRNLYFYPEKNDAMDYLWEHSLSVAVFAKVLSSYLKIKKEGAYLAGLLHDIGKLVINLHDPDAYAKIVKKADEKGEDFAVLEENVFGFTHIDTGYYLLDGWNFSEFIKNTILFHHNFISYRGDEPVIGIVAFADELVHKYIEGKPAFPDFYLKRYCLTNEEVDIFAEKTVGIVAQYHLMLAPEHPDKQGNSPRTQEQEGKSFAGISAASEKR